MTESQRVVIGCLADEPAFATVRDSLRGSGLALLNRDRRALRAGHQFPTAVALVYDLNGPNSQTARALVEWWQRKNPAKPVLLYYRPSLDNAALVGQLTQRAGISARMQAPTLRGEGQQLASLIRHLVATGPELLVRGVLRSLNQEIPTNVSACLEELVKRLAHSAEEPLQSAASQPPQTFRYGR
jgi:hypothetical protein